MSIVFPSQVISIVVYRIDDKFLQVNKNRITLLARTPTAKRGAAQTWHIGKAPVI